MNYEQRKALATKCLGQLLSGYEPPYSLRDDQAKQIREANEIAELVVNTLPTGMNQDEIKGTFERAGKTLKKTAKSRSWPIARDIIEAIKGSITQEPVKVQKTDARVLDRARELFTSKTESAQFGRFNGKAHGLYRDEWIAQALINEGILENERDAHWRGFDMTRHMKKIKTQRMTMAEWKNHIRITANLRGISEADAEHQEITGEGCSMGPISESELPHEIASRNEEFAPW